MRGKKGISLIILIIIMVLLIVVTIVIISKNNSKKTLESMDSQTSKNLQEIIQMANIYWKEGYTNGLKEQSKLEEYVINSLKKSNIDVTRYDIIVTANGVDVTLSMKIGDYIEYGVEYTDIYISSNKYSRQNGWRILSAKKNYDGTYSNVKLISTGIPAGIYYDNIDMSNNSWWVKDSNKLIEYIKETGEKYNNYYTEYDTNYKLQGVAGMYYNFEDIRFAPGIDDVKNNSGWFTRILTNDIEYSKSTNSYIEMTGGELFNLFGENASVRILTLPEVNIALERQNTDSIDTIVASEDKNGLYRLANISNVPGMNNFIKYGDNTSYWLASTTPYYSPQNFILNIYGDGNISFGYYKLRGIRPVIIIRPDLCARTVDYNNNGVPEIEIIE